MNLLSLKSRFSSHNYDTFNEMALWGLQVHDTASDFDVVYLVVLWSLFVVVTRFFSA